MNRETLQQMINEDTYGLLDISEPRSQARAFFEDKCNHSINDSLHQLECMSDAGMVHKYEQPTHGRTVYLFDDGSSMQSVGWKWELKVVEAA